MKRENTHTFISDFHTLLLAKKAAAGLLDLVFSASSNLGAEEANLHFGRRYPVSFSPQSKQYAKLCLLLIKVGDSTKNARSPKAFLNTYIVILH